MEEREVKVHSVRRSKFRFAGLQIKNRKSKITPMLLTKILVTSNLIRASQLSGRCHDRLMNTFNSDSFNLDNVDRDNVDRDLRLEKLRREIKELGGGEVVLGKASDCDPGIEEAFLEQVLAFETGEGVVPFDALEKEGLKFPPLEQLNDET